MLVRLSVIPILSFSLALAAAGDRVQLTLDTSEADQVLAILALRNLGKPIPEDEWQKLFATAPYRRLKQREKAIGEKFHDPPSLSATTTSDASFYRTTFSRIARHY